MFIEVNDEVLKENTSSIACRFATNPKLQIFHNAFTISTRRRKTLGFS